MSDEKPLATVSDVEEMLSEPGQALRAAVAAAAGANNRILQGEFAAAGFVQEQATLWLAIHARLREEKLHREYEAASEEKGRQSDKDFIEGYNEGVRDGITQERRRVFETRPSPFRPSEGAPRHDIHIHGIDDRPSPFPTLNPNSGNEKPPVS